MGEGEIDHMRAPKALLLLYHSYTSDLATYYELQMGHVVHIYVGPCCPLLGCFAMTFQCQRIHSCS